MKIVSTFARLAALVGLTLSMALAPVAPVSAASPLGVADSLSHFLSCFGLLFSNPAEHAAECGAGHEFTGQFSHAWGSENYVPPPTNCLVPGAFRDPRTQNPFIWLASPPPCGCPISSPLQQGGDPQILEVVGCCTSYEPLGEMDPRLLQVDCCASARLWHDPSTIEVSARPDFDGYFWAVC